jgi:hypothetical protein
MMPENSDFDRIIYSNIYLHSITMSIHVLFMFISMSKVYIDAEYLR